MNLGHYVKSRRENIGLTQQQLAEKIGLTNVTISRYESGEREPNWIVFLKLCEALGMNPFDFIESEDK